MDRLPGPLRIERLTAPHPAWLAMRRALWPDGGTDAELRREMQRALADPETCVQFMAVAGEQALGFAEAAVRRDAVNGATVSPVAFLEGLYVVPAARRRGVARRLVQAVIDWAVAAGFTELASDALLENTASHAMHRALGFEEAERVVCFRRAVP
ncbi:MAG TPA: aminoglycoside 6'-N-acetyltransferase [Steroidobacteraceae bacterium]|nr:aminoglycoside 6'-N-acetyltransferase [Steroidobacteraceae bacterium]